MIWGTLHQQSRITKVYKILKFLKSSLKILQSKFSMQLAF